MIQTRVGMDNRDVDLFVPERARQSLADGDQLDLQEKNVPELTSEYVTYNGASYHALVEVNSIWADMWLLKFFVVRCAVQCRVTRTVVYLNRLLPAMATPLAWPDPEVEVRSYYTVIIAVHNVAYVIISRSRTTRSWEQLLVEMWQHWDMLPERQILLQQFRTKWTWWHTCCMSYAKYRTNMCIVLLFSVWLDSSALCRLQWSSGDAERTSGEVQLWSRQRR